MSRVVFPLLLLVLPAVSVVSGCAGEQRADQEAAAVEQAVREAVDAYNRHDIAGFLALWTDSGLEQQFGASREELAAHPQTLFAGPRRQLRSLSETLVAGDQAVTEAEFVVGLGLAREALLLVKREGRWLLDGSEPLLVEVPRGTAIVQVRMREFAFEYDPGHLATGNLAFELSNVGLQAHEMVALRVPEDFAIEQLLQGPLPPPDAEVLAGVGPLDPGARSRLVLAQPLPPGRYLLVCFLPDTSDPFLAPHAGKGMIAEFTIGGAGGHP